MFSSVGVGRSCGWQGDIVATLGALAGKTATLIVRTMDMVADGELVLRSAPASSSTSAAATSNCAAQADASTSNGGSNEPVAPRKTDSPGQNTQSMPRRKVGVGGSSGKPDRAPATQPPSAPASTPPPSSASVPTPQLSSAPASTPQPSSAPALPNGAEKSVEVVDLVESGEEDGGDVPQRRTPPTSSPKVKVENGRNGASVLDRKRKPSPRPRDPNAREGDSPAAKRRRVEDPRRSNGVPRGAVLEQKQRDGESPPSQQFLLPSFTAPSAGGGRRHSSPRAATAAASAARGRDSSQYCPTPHPSRGGSLLSGPQTLLCGPTRRVWGPLPRPIVPPSRKRPRVLLPTGMNKSQREVVDSAVSCLDQRSRVMSDFDATVTHIVTSLMPAEPSGSGTSVSPWRCKRTLKYMLGLAYGCWVVSVGWAKDVCDGGSGAEEPFEVKQDNCASGGAYLARQCALRGQPPLFAGWRFVLPDFGKPHYQMSSSDLRLLFRLLGATVVEGLDAWAALVAYGEVMNDERDEDRVGRSFWRASRGAMPGNAARRPSETRATPLPVPDQRWLLSEGLRTDSVLLVDGNQTSDAKAARWQRETGCATVDMLWVLQCVSHFRITSILQHRVPEPDESHRPPEHATVRAEAML